MEHQTKIALISRDGEREKKITGDLGKDPRLARISVVVRNADG